SSASPSENFSTANCWGSNNLTFTPTAGPAQDDFTGADILLTSQYSNPGDTPWSQTIYYDSRAFSTGPFKGLVIDVPWSLNGQLPLQVDDSISTSALVSGTELVGIDGPSAIVQNGSANSTGTLYLGGNGLALGQGSYTLAGGSLSGTTEYVGYTGFGTV